MFNHRLQRGMTLLALATLPFLYAGSCTVNLPREAALFFDVRPVFDDVEIEFDDDWDHHHGGGFDFFYEDTYYDDGYYYDDGDYWDWW